MPSSMLTTKQVAEHLNTNTERVRILIREKQLPAVRLGSKSYRIDLEDLRLFKKQRLTVNQGQ
jgi:excisionase family DNA binding protein